MSETNPLSDLARKTLSLKAERPDDPLIAPLDLPEDCYTTRQTPSGATYGWELTELGKTAQRKVITERIAALKRVLKSI